MISKEYVNAGYDIISYSTPSQKPDRFIEVKSLGGKEVFYWSQNEKVIANFLQDQYYLYLVQFVYREPIIWAIRNPLKHLDALGISLEPIQYRIQMDMEILYEHAEEDSVHGIEYRKVAMKFQGDGGNEF